MANKNASANKATGLQIGKSTLVVTSDGKKSRVRKENVAKKRAKNGAWQVVKPRRSPQVRQQRNRRCELR